MRCSQKSNAPDREVFPFSSLELVHPLNQIYRQLDIIERDSDLFGFMSYAKLTGVAQSRGTTSHPYAHYRSGIVGREREETKIRVAILNHVAESDGVLAVAILGMGGIGKTSLAQLIYNDPKIRSKFEIILWVNDCLKRDDIFYALHQMRMQVMEENHLNLDEDCRSLEQMKMELYELPRERRFIVVVDDTWSDFLFERFFGEVLHIGSKGSVVIVTTRVQEVAHSFIASLVYRLEGLSEEVCWKLFAKYAFASNGLQIQPEFDAFARKIVKLCSGHPMVVKMIGTYLYNNDNVQQWTEVLETLQAHYNYGILPVFELICDKLPSYLKLPFCTLPLLEVYSVEELIRLWTALGFVYSDDPNQQPEYIARKYLRELAESALCADVEYAPGDVVRDIKLHDLVNDLATKISNEHGLRNLRVQYTLSTDSDIRYLILKKDGLAYIDLLPKLHELTKLHLLMLLPGQKASAQRVTDVLSCFKSLRVFGLGGCDIEILPDSVVQLKHLRYLDVSRNDLLKSLPDSICNLWYLQTLLLHGCHQLKKVPARIGKLQNLRYLTLTTSQENLQEEIGQLTSLRTLGLSSCYQLVSLPCSLKNLKNLQTFGIVDCPKMDLLASSSVEALKGMDDIDTLLLSGLPEFKHLPPNLGTPSLVMKHLLIQFSMKLTETSWINQFLSLHSLTVEDCPELSTLMEGGISQFNNLVELAIRGCPRLDGTNWIRQFVALRSLIIDKCRNLASLDAGFTELKKLERLEIRRCPVLINLTKILGGVDSFYTSHVRVVELDGVPLPRIRRVYGKLKKWYRLSESGCSTQEDDTKCSPIMDVASSSSHVNSSSISASEISENAS